MKSLTAEQIRNLQPESLKAMRKEGLSYVQIAERCGVSFPTIYARFRGFKTTLKQKNKLK